MAEKLDHQQQPDFAAKALSLCSHSISPAFGDHTYGDPSELIDTYRQWEGSPSADRLSRAVAELLDHRHADVRDVAALFFSIWPTAAGHERLLDIIENGPRQRIQFFGEGILWSLFSPDWFNQALETMAEGGNARAIALRARTDLAELLGKLRA